VDATGRSKIFTKVKVLMGIKLLAYGVSTSAFVDYFQMDVTTGWLCFQKLCKCIAESDFLCTKFDGATSCPAWSGRNVRITGRYSNWVEELLCGLAGGFPGEGEGFNYCVRGRFGI
jgi:hypothetical protein